MATQGCPCGYRGDPLHECRCTPLQVQRYRNRLSGPLRDQIDLIADVPAVPLTALTAGPSGEPSTVVRQRVVEARERLAARFQDMPVRVNAALHGRALRRHCELDANGSRLLEAAVRRLALSARGYDRVLKVARTIADLAGADNVEVAHIKHCAANQSRGTYGVSL